VAQPRGRPLEPATERVLVVASQAQTSPRPGLERESAECESASLCVSGAVTIGAVECSPAPKMRPG